MNDTRTTDYALGELTGSARDEFERELAVSDALQVELTDTIKMVTTLDHLPPSTECFDANVRIDLLRACEENQAAFRRKKTLIRWGVPLGLAAAASVAFLSTLVYRPSVAELVIVQNGGAPIASLEEIQNPDASSATNAITGPAGESKTHLDPSTDTLAKNTTPQDIPQRSKSKSVVCPIEHDLTEQGLLTDEIGSVSSLASQLEKPGQTIPLKENQKDIRNATFGGRLVDTKVQRASEYSLDVDPSGYARIRAQILASELPPPNSVHIEELINAFTYNYAEQAGKAAFSTNIESGLAPWNEDHLLIRVGIRAQAFAENVKVEVQFNPAQAAYFRLIGYENQRDAEKLIRFTTKVAPPFEHTALYEVIPAGKSQPKIAPKDFQRTQAVVEYQPVDTGDLLTMKIHHRPSGVNQCQLAVFRFENGSAKSFDKNSVDFRFVAAVAAFGMKLRHSPDSANIAWPKIEQIALGSLGTDPDGQRADFAKLMAKASSLEGRGISKNLFKAPFLAIQLIP